MTQEGRSGSPSGPATLGPDGQPIWSGSAYGGLDVFHGVAPPAVAELAAGLPKQGHYIPAVGRDSGGRYWLAWYGAGSPTETGLYLLRFDPGTLQPIGAPQRAPGSASPFNNGLRLAIACWSTCRLVYKQADDRAVSWAWGEPKATIVATVPKANLGSFVAAYTPGGRLWVAWQDSASHTFGATLGNAAGAGGRRLRLGRPGGAPCCGGALTGVTLGNTLVLVDNWGVSPFSRFVDVVPAG